MISSFGELTANDLLNWAKMQTIGGSFFVNPNVTTTGLPDIPDKYFVGTLEIGQEADCKITLTNNSLETFINKSLIKSGEAEPSWIGWREIATATPPQEYDLPLAEGITALQPCTYYKNQFSEVTLGGCTSGSVSDGATIATLPEGFRPDHPVERPATFTANGNRYAGSVFIAANGIVSIHTPAEATNVAFAASFLAKN